MSESGAWYRRNFVSGNCRRASALSRRLRAHWAKWATLRMQLLNVFAA